MACASAILPPVSFDECNPSIRFGQIKTVFITRDTSADVLTSASSLTEWNTRINATTTIPGTGAAPIRKLTVIGSLSEPEVTETDVSGDRKKYSAPKYTLPAKIDELSIENYAMANDIAAANGAQFKMWFLSGGLLFGGNSGISVSCKMNPVIPEGKTEVSYLQAQFTWEGVMADPIVSPFS